MRILWPLRICGFIKRFVLFDITMECVVYWGEYPMAGDK